MAAPKWMDNPDQLTLPDVQPHHLEDITKFLELLPKRIHPWCKHTNIIRLVRTCSRIVIFCKLIEYLISGLLTYIDSSISVFFILTDFRNAVIRH